MNRKLMIALIGKACPESVKVTEDQGANDIMKRIVLKHRKCAPDYDKIAMEFYSGSVKQICKRLFEFCKNNIHYVEETVDVQNISSPQTILTRGVGDCKSYALFCGGVLDALKRQGLDITWCYRFASYKMFDETPGHVFVVVYPGTEYEIWVDPVLRKFDDKKDYCYHMDRKVKTETIAGKAILRGIGCDCNGQKIGNTSQTGSAIMSIAPTLAYVPVIGYVAAAAAEVVGFFLKVFGSSYQTSDNVRWLTAKYQYYVLGDSSAVSNHHVNEANTANAQKWFSVVTGVPIYDQYRYHALRGTSPTTGNSLNLTRQQRGQNYLTSAPDAVSQGVTLDQAIAATYNADQFIEDKVPGSWKGFVAAPALISKDATTPSSTYVDASGNIQSTANDQNKMLLLVIGAMAAAYFIIK